MSAVPAYGPGPGQRLPDTRAYQARFAPLLMIPWLVVCTLAAFWILERFDWAADTPANDQPAGQFAFNVVFNFVVVPLPLIAGLAEALWSRAHGAADGARRALWINGGLLAVWTVLMANAILQDFVGY